MRTPNNATAYLPRGLPHKNQPPRAAFTLIELLVVVAIVMLLAALLLPALKSAKERGRAVACLSNLHQIGLSVFMYGGDYAQAYPVMTYNLAQPAALVFSKIPVGDGADVAEGLAWMHLLFPYHQKARLYWCPDASNPQYGWGPNSANLGWSYGASPGFFPQLNATGGLLCPGGCWCAPVKIGLEAYRENKIMIADAPSGQPGGNRFCVAYGYTGDPANPYTAMLHDNGANCLFIDGHVERLPAACSAFWQPDQSWYRPDFISRP